MRQARRIGAYGVCTDDQGRVLLARIGPAGQEPGRWQLPGGGIEHGEHPADAVRREFLEETGLTVTSSSLRQVSADLLLTEEGELLKHTDRVIYDVTVAPGELVLAGDGAEDALDWFGPEQLAELPLTTVSAEALGQPRPPHAVAAEEAASALDSVGGSAGTPAPTRDSVLAAAETPQVTEDSSRGQRFSVYGLVTDPDDRVLLIRISPNYPGAGRWHLPGGGTDFGETPEVAFTRELAEETGQFGEVIGLLSVSHKHSPTTPWRGQIIDWHVVRVLMRARVAAPTEAVVAEVDGSTELAQWLTVAQARQLALTEVAAEALAILP